MSSPMTLFGLIILLLTGMSVSAQDAEIVYTKPQRLTGVGGGVRSGVSVAHVLNAQVSGDYSRAAPAIGTTSGGIVRLSFSAVVDLHIEALITSRGVAAVADYQVYTERGGVYTYYLEMPVIVRKVYPGKGRFSAFVGGGPSMGIGLFIQKKVKRDVQGVTEKVKEHFAWPVDDLKRIDLLLEMDAGLLIELNKTTALEIGVRPFFGVLNTTNTKALPPEQDALFKNNIGGTISAAIIFGR